MASQNTEQRPPSTNGIDAGPRVQIPLAQSPMSDAFPTATTASAPASTSASPTTPGFGTQQGQQGQKPSLHARRMTRQRATETSLNTAYLGEVIPPQTPWRTLVLCFDGTGDAFDNDNSNIVQLMAMLKKGDKNQQLVYYQAGIGTYTIPQIATPFLSKLSKTVDMMIASNLNHHVMGGYEFLMENYREGDKICIFGFSRGAYTARALAGMVHKVGLLPNSNHQQVPFAYRMYMKDDETGWKQSVLFKRTFSIDVDIEFVGVFDTVASVGLIPRKLPFTKSNTAIKTFRHAISLDEHRAKFKANYYQVTTRQEAERGDFVLPVGIIDEPAKENDKHGCGHDRPQHTKHNSKAIIEDIVHAARHGAEAVKRTASNDHRSASKEKEKEKTSKSKEEEARKRRLEELYTDRTRPTDVLEVWFAGCHCDVGGGSVPNDTRHSLARIPLRWMIRQCFLTDSGIQFEADKVAEIAGIDPTTLWPIVLPRPPPLPVPVKPVDEKKKGKKVEAAAERRERSSIDKTLVPADQKAAAATAKEVDLNSVGGTDEKGNDENGSEDTEDESKYVFLGEDEEELRDALCPIYDQLEIAKHWWVLELLPMKQRIQRDDGTWKKKIEMNLARPRVLPHQHKRGIKVHRTVKMRMEAQGYKPRLHFEIEPEWVD